jgi:adenine-specific DNA-methyltransferase
MKAWARASAESTPARLRAGHARAFCAVALDRYWRRLHGRRERPLPAPPARFKPLRPDVAAAAVALADAAVSTTIDVAAYVIGSTYAAMLPPETRARRGVYYTPPPLVQRLMDRAETAGIDWSTARALDPACGGGGFLGPMARRMVVALRGCDRSVILRSIGARLRGAEIDPFAAWMSQIFLEATLHVMLGGADGKAASAVDVGDSLTRPQAADFDLVMGNPPYGRVTLRPSQREEYRRSLFGHANLYGVFLDLAIRKTRPRGGVIAYVTPPSFLSGEYFKRLREVLVREAGPVSLDLVSERTGVFEGVLQETLLAVYRRGRAARSVNVEFVDASETAVRVEGGDSIELPSRPEDPWILPRSREAVDISRRLRALPGRLASWGYGVSTGPLVWNRHKNQLRARPDGNTVPIVWAEAIGADGAFSFGAARRSRRPYCSIGPSEQWLLVRRSCVLLKRTTSKEQRRRLIATRLPPEFIAEHGAVTVENHLNMIVPIVADPPVDTATLAAFLNSEVADRAFRCISGSVAVSAYELEALPIPLAAEMQELSRALETASRVEVERACEALYMRRR